MEFAEPVRKEDEDKEKIILILHITVAVSLSYQVQNSRVCIEIFNNINVNW